MDGYFFYCDGILVIGIHPVSVLTSVGSGQCSGVETMSQEALSLPSRWEPSTRHGTTPFAAQTNDAGRVLLAGPRCFAAAHPPGVAKHSESFEGNIRSAVQNTSVRPAPSCPICCTSFEWFFPSHVPIPPGECWVVP